MSHGTEHHLEEAEHAQHAKHDPFDRRVAMTMAITAATLACVSLLSHRSHAETTNHQIAAANQWNYYQAKKNRGYLYEADAELLLASKEGPPPETAYSAGQVAQWKKRADRYAAEAKEIEEKARGFEEQAHAAHHRSDFFDSGELSLQLALVLCSVAVLARRAVFWYAGIGVAAVGALVAAYGFFFVH
jgi:hypothetical protein